MKGDGLLRESLIERKLVIEVKKRGGLAVKFVSPGLDGVPDRLVLFPGGKLAFVELKATGKTMRPLQEKRARQLTALGFQVYCVDNKEKIGGVLDEIQTA
ncbi:VRR-NUC domain-containing protein [Anaerosinus sp.]